MRSMRRVSSIGLTSGSVSDLSLVVAGFARIQPQAIARRSELWRVQLHTERGRRVPVIVRVTCHYFGRTAGTWNGHSALLSAVQEPLHSAFIAEV